MSNILDGLNDMQAEAVQYVNGPLLILAGAGSGKTRVLTHRIAYLISECGVNPYQILAVTFTNKAAGEMKERIGNIVGAGSENVWASTFHSTCVKILRRFIEKLGFDRDFIIYDRDDQKSLMKDIIKGMNLDPKKYKDKTFLNVISSAKDELIDPDMFIEQAGGDHDYLLYGKAYNEYQKRLKANNALDFDDLIMKTVQLFRISPETLEYYRNRFRFILVDEYQDTNTAQFELIRLLAEHTNEYGDIEHNLCVVGDDDQSIYKFRGANIRNILDFEKVYPEATVIKLEQNYRSTQQILDAANAVIRNNYGRKDKALWTDEKDGEIVRLKQFDTAYDEATFIADDIGKLMRNGKLRYSETAVLYRTNAQSRLLEEKFVLNGIPYDIVGGTNFYARREIKDLLAYLKTIDNGLDDIAVKRIINVPRRGIGATTIEHVQSYADERQISFYDAMCEADQIMAVARSASKLTDFVTMIRAFRTKMKSYSLEELLKDVLDVTGYMEYLKTLDDDTEEESNDRAGNVDELISKIAAYEENEEIEQPTLSGFLEEVALVSDIDRIGEDNEKVLLMTIHSAKGLEFEHVYIAGLEEGVFPSYMTLGNEDSDPEGVEEERRLAYVAITRAKKHLTLTAAKRRMVRGETQYNRLSRFVAEIPRDLLDQSSPASSQPAFLFDDGETIDEYESVEDTFGKGVKPKLGASSGSSRSSLANTYKLKATPKPAKKIPRAVPSEKPYIAGVAKTHARGNLAGLSKGMPQSATKPDYGVGDKVSHVKYGIGTVTELQEGPRDYKVTVMFDEAGQKIMYAAFAKLKKV